MVEKSLYHNCTLIARPEVLVGGGVGNGRSRGPKVAVVDRVRRVGGLSGGMVLACGLDRSLAVRWFLVGEGELVGSMGFAW